MDIFLLYIWTRLDAVHNAAAGIFIIFGIIGILSVVLSPILMDVLSDHGAAVKRGIKWVFILFGLALGTSIIIPTKTDVALIIAGTATYRAMTSEKGSRIASAFATYIEEQALSLLEKKAKK